MTSELIPAAEWRTIVANVPIVSVDLLVRHEDGVLLGRRTNDPVKGEWYPPGGRVEKMETREAAVDRVAGEELGVEVEIVESLGAFEHMYDTANEPDVGGKHYLANGYVVDIVDGTPTPDDQHDTLQQFASAPEQLHEYVQAYLDAATTIDGWL
jgi:colanic acid biosynthesis protein WcaH